MEEFQVIAFSLIIILILVIVGEEIENTFFLVIVSFFLFQMNIGILFSIVFDYATTIFIITLLLTIRNCAIAMSNRR
jgi:hypothetical protein